MPLERVEFIESWYERLVSRTNEKEVLPKAVSDLLQQSRYDSCLEIGLGTAPVFAEKLADRFGAYKIIEKRSLDVALPKNASLILSDWESYDGSDHYDVIIASHVIYYFRNKKQAVEKILEHLRPQGRAFIVVNGKDGDYGPLKEAFSTMVGQPYRFTYDELKDILRGKKYSEHAISSTVIFDSPEDLFETLRLSFDQYPHEYEDNKDRFLEYISKHLSNKVFTINQVIFEIQTI